MRTLATIQKIAKLEPIEGADQIEKATVLGWHLVVRKGEFKEGDLCVYFEVDSLLPQLPEFEFLGKGGSLKKSYTEGKEYTGYRLKTIRLRGQISQGLAMPLSILEGKKYPKDTRKSPVYEFSEGVDVTALLGVVKWEPAIPANLAGQVKGFFPSFIPKTDETRIQSFPAVLERYPNTIFYVTEKVDGTSCTIFVKDGELNVCSRNLNIKEDSNNTFWKVANELKLKEKLEKECPNIALQGELIGDHIQNNKLKINGHKILFFSAYNMELRKYLDKAEFFSLAKKLEISTVPLIDDKYKLHKTVDEMVTYATRKSLISPDAWVEGIVVRPLTEMQDEDLGRLSFKVVNPEFLLKYGE
jgi:RNA ligase (TIGR02306 family)